MNNANIHRFTTLALLGIITLIATGCCNVDYPRRPARINHLAFFKLNNPGDAAELIRDCDSKLALIPGVTSYYCGQHLDVGRDSVDGNYDVGFFVGFETEEDYAVYVDHPNHVEVVTKWGPRLEWLRVHDVLDETDYHRD